LREVRYKGFTLIEMSIVLVIIGLIVGGVLAGQSLVAAAGVRATISQIERYNTAVNTFRGKYGGLPGDLNASLAAQFGFTSRTGTVGWGDGNGVIEDDAGNPAWRGDSGPEYAEPCLFWVDLTTANGQKINMIDGGFVGGLPGGNAGPCQLPWSFSPDAYYPQAKLGGGNYIYVWSGGITTNSANTAQNSLNYFGIGTSTAANGGAIFNPGLTVQQAYSIDKKMDDGLPQTGRVIAVYLTTAVFWAAGGGNEASGPNPGSVASPSATSCYDNNGNTSNPMQYSITQSNGAGVNCALSFQFQ
jgi:prepilin-type N-terminal cleavage/methylation domain-containing protein